MSKSTGYCPKCGKLISYRFPIHTCKPTKNFLRLKAEEERRLAQIMTADDFGQFEEKRSKKK